MVDLGNFLIRPAPRIIYPLFVTGGAKVGPPLLGLGTCRQLSFLAPGFPSTGQTSPRALCTARVVQAQRWSARLGAPTLVPQTARFLSLRRSRSLRPPQMPNRSSCASAYYKHSLRTSHDRQTFLASRVDPPFSGKNASGSVCAHNARSCQPSAPPSSTSRSCISKPPRPPTERPA